MKKALSLTLALTALLSLCACGGSEDTAQSPEPSAEVTAQPTPDSSEPEDQTPPSDSSTEPESTEEPPADEALSALVDAIYEACPLELMMMETHAIDLTNADGMAAYNTGLDEQTLALLDAAVINQSMTGSQAYSLVLARVKDSADAEGVAAALLDDAPVTKWVCVTPNAVRVARYGDVICCIMTDTSLADPDALIEAFATAAGGCDAQDGREVDAAEALEDNAIGIPVPEGEPAA